MTDLSGKESQLYPFGMDKEKLCTALRGLATLIEDGTILPQEVEHLKVTKTDDYSLTTFSVKYVEKLDGQEG